MSLFFLILSLISFFFSILFFFFMHGKRKKNQYVLEDTVSKPKFTILIPARDESQVISTLLESIKTQTRKIPMKDVYVIVEKDSDPTVLICEKYGASVIIRKHLDGQSKGYALKEAIEFLKEHQFFYDAYFIFDADNVMDKNYLKEMETDYKKGYGISMGYRNFKNGQSLVSTSAGLTYTMINTLINRPGIKDKKNIMVMGTGFYIHGKYIKEWGTFPFHSLTEDVEISYYATLHGISTNYNEKAQFYDEQPEKFHQSVLQRKRWIRGYFSNLFSYIPKFRKKILDHPWNVESLYSMMYGIFPVLFFVLGLLMALCSCVVSLIQKHVGVMGYVLVFGMFLITLYFSLLFFTFLLIYLDREKLNISRSMKFWALLYHPFFLMSYVYVFILTLFQKDIKWERIDHSITDIS